MSRTFVRYVCQKELMMIPDCVELSLSLLDID